MEQKKILVVDDEQDLCNILLFNLTSAGYLAEAACSAEEALDLIRSSQAAGSKFYDLLLLDVMMPGLSGFELAERLKADKQTAFLPIIFLTAKGTEDDMLQGFDVGADDYVAKPFSVRELMARVKVVLSRTAMRQTDEQEALVYEGLHVNCKQKSVTVDGKPVMLTKTEYELLRLMLEQRGLVFSRQQMLEKIWPQDVIVTARTVDVNITRLRRKIGRYASCIVTRQGFGYCFEELK